MKRFALAVIVMTSGPAFASARESLTVLPEKTDGVPRHELLHRYLLREAAKQWDARRQSVKAALKSPAAARARQERLRRDYRTLLGDFPDKTPLRAQVTGKIECDGYVIEKVAYQSRPGHYVTANLYLPTQGKGPWPGVLMLCGHSNISKAYDAYQRACILMVKSGLVVLIADPVGQGERNQFLDSTGQIMRIGGKAVWELYYEHTLIDVGARLVGRSTVAYQAWDNIRGIDYLLSRPEVDNSKPVGCTGNSGGGTQTTFLMAFDDRIGPAAPSCYIKSKEGYFNNHGMTDACQQLAGEGAMGIEEADFFSMRAPRPSIILSATGDYFSIHDARETYQEARDVYTTLGVPERMGMFEFSDRHGFTKPRRQAATRWMRRWFYDDDRPVVEPTLSVQTERDLWVTKNGQADSFYKDAVNVPQLNLRRAKALAPQRRKFFTEMNKDQREKEIRRLIALPSHAQGESAQSAVSERVGTVVRKGYRIEKLIVRHSGDGLTTGLLFIPDKPEGRLPGTLYVDSRGKQADAGVDGPLAKLVSQGRIVLSIDVRGWGETACRLSAKQASEMRNDEYDNAMLAMYIGRPLLGQRVGDVLASLDMLVKHAHVNAQQIDLVAIDRAGPVALHAAVLDERFAAVTIRGSIRSWIDDVVAKPLAPNVIGHVIPGALTKYDLTDLSSEIGKNLMFDAVGSVNQALRR